MESTIESLNDLNLSKHQIEINDLPPEILLAILQYLDVYNLLRCRLVSKFWHDSVKQTGLLQLSLTSSSRLHLPHLFKSSIFNLKKLKYLKIQIRLDNYYCDKLDGCLNQLENLIYLEFNEYFARNFTLNLPNLDRFYVRSIGYDLIADLPKLRYLRCEIGLNLIKLKQFDSIVCLKTYCLNEYVLKFKNLEKLRVDYVDKDFKNMNALKKFANLNLIHFFFEKSTMHRNLEEFNKTKQAIEQLLIDKEALKKEFKIYFKFNLIDNIAQVVELEREQYDIDCYDNENDCQVDFDYNSD